MSISAIDLINAFLANPITKEGKSHMGETLFNQQATINHFLNECYVEPDFVKQDSVAVKVNSDSDCHLDEHQDYDFFIPQNNRESDYKYEINRRCSAFQKEEFEKHLLGSNINNADHRLYGTIFLIEGPAGCGKTTYAHKLLNKKNINVDYFDIETATQKSCRFFNGKYDIESPGFDPIDTIEIQLMQCIHTKLAKKHNEDEDEYRNRLNDICNIYDQFFDSELITVVDTPLYRNFFKVLKDYADCKKDYAELTALLHEQLSINTQNKKAESSREGIPGIKFLLGLVMRIYFCHARIFNQKTILFLDNIERYIISDSGYPLINIYDIHLQRIINSIYSIVDETEDLIYKIYDNLYKIDTHTTFETSFGILIAFRESTLNIAKNNSAFTCYFEKHHAENTPIYVNISNWFDYNQIMKKKAKYFLGAESDQFANNITLAFDNIINDITKSKWCLHNLFIDIFNNNFRRFAANLTEAFFYYEDVLIFFNDMWKAAERDKNYLKHMCRKLILSIVLRFMQNNKSGLGEEGFFSSLMAELSANTNYDKIEKASYLRRILTFLDNMDKDPDCRSEVSFPVLIKEILHKPVFKINRQTRNSNVKINDPKISVLSDILSRANDTAKIKTNGVELLTLNVDTEKMKNNTLSDEMNSQWKDYLNEAKPDKQNFNIKITPAGSVFAMFLPCFEYFACRYQPDSIPIIMIKKEDDRRRLLFGYEVSDKHGKPLKVPGIVDRAMICIDSVIKFETRQLNMGNGKNLSIPKWLYKYSYSDKGIVHPIRIIYDHLGYLHDYRNFLLQYADYTYQTEPYKQNTGEGEVDKAILIYRKKLGEVIAKNPSYIGIGEIPKNDFF